MNLKKFFQRQIARLHEIRDAPHAVAGGLAVGAFWGFTPFAGLKTLLSIGTAWASRVSRLAAVIAVALHDLLIPLWPVILRWEYQIGYWLFSKPHRLPPPLHGHSHHFHFRLDSLFTADAASILGKTFAGSVILGLPAAGATYWIMLGVLQARARRREAEAAAESTP